jgi:hypothetical protein
MRRSTIALLAGLAVGGLGGTALIGTAGGGTTATPAGGVLSAATFFSNLNGAKEIGPNGQRNAGDPNGAGAFSAFRVGNRLCYGIQVGFLSRPTAAHIHRGTASRNGPIVVPLRAPSATLGLSSACVTVATSLLNEIRRNPGGFYANVHTTQFPNGAVRGQLSRLN